MRTLAIATALFFGLVGCSRHTEPPTDSRSFFVGIDKSKLSEPARSTITSAEKNIDLVLRGHPPECKVDPTSALSDGGTITYKCNGYDLTVLQRLHKIGDVYGVIYGPVVAFPGGGHEISYTRFFTSEELVALMGDADGR